MIGLTLFGKIPGFSQKNFCPDGAPQVDLSNRDLGHLVLIDNDVLVLPSSTSGLVKIARRKTRWGVITWIGLYIDFADATIKRNGDYCGVGIWLLNATATGVHILNLLRRSLGPFRDDLVPYAKSPLGHLENYTPPHLDSLGEFFTLVENSERILNEEAGLGANNPMTGCFLDATAGDGSTSLGDWIDIFQTRSGLSNFGSAWLSVDARVKEAVASKGRLQILNAAQVLASPSDEPENTSMAPAVPVPDSVSTPPTSGSLLDRYTKGETYRQSNPRNATTSLSDSVEALRSDVLELRTKFEKLEHQLSNLPKQVGSEKNASARYAATPSFLPVKRNPRSILNIPPKRLTLAIVAVILVMLILASTIWLLFIFIPAPDQHASKTPEKTTLPPVVSDQTLAPAPVTSARSQSQVTLSQTISEETQKKNEEKPKKDLTDYIANQKLIWQGKVRCDTKMCTMPVDSYKSMVATIDRALNVLNGVPREK